VFDGYIHFKYPNIMINPPLLSKNNDFGSPGGFIYSELYGGDVHSLNIEFLLFISLRLVLVYVLTKIIIYLSYEAFQRVRRWWKCGSDHIPERINTLADNLLAEIEAEAENFGFDRFDSEEADPLTLLEHVPDGLGRGGSRRIKRRAPYLRHIVSEAKIKFSVYRLSDYTEANRLCVRRFLADTMRDHNVRPSHIMALLDRATAMVFIPTKTEVDGALLRGSMAAASRDQNVEGYWWNWVRLRTGYDQLRRVVTLPSRQ